MSKNHSCPFLSEVIASSWFSAHVPTSSEPRNTNSSFSKFFFKLTLVFPSNIFPRVQVGASYGFSIPFLFSTYQSTANALFLSVQVFPYKNTEKIKSKCFFLDHNLLTVALPSKSSEWVAGKYLNKVMISGVQTEVCATTAIKYCASFDQYQVT